MSTGLRHFGYTEYRVTYLNYWDEEKSLTLHAKNRSDVPDLAYRDVDVMEVRKIEAMD